MTAVGGASAVVLVGLMGSGKSTVGRLVAEELGRPMRDSDEELEATYGLSAAEQVAQHGADLLHQREARQLRQALADPRAPVVAAAASVVEDPACRAALAGAFVVWLDAPAAVLADRMRDGAHRPHYQSDLEKMLTEQYQRRAPWLRQVADLRVDVTALSPRQAAARVLAALSGTG